MRQVWRPECGPPSLARRSVSAPSAFPAKRAGHLWCANFQGVMSHLVNRRSFFAFQPSISAEGAVFATRAASVRHIATGEMVCRHRRDGKARTPLRQMTLGLAAPLNACTTGRVVFAALSVVGTSLWARRKAPHIAASDDPPPGSAVERMRYRPGRLCSPVCRRYVAMGATQGSARCCVRGPPPGSAVSRSALSVGSSLQPCLS